MATVKRGSFRDLVSGLLDVAIPTFGEEIDYRPKVGGSFSIKGVYDNRYITVNPDTEEVVTSNVLTLGVKLCDLPFAPAQGDEVRISQMRFRVTDSQEDGHGGSTLILHRL